MSLVLDGDHLLLKQVRALAPHLDEARLAAIVAKPDMQVFWGPGTLVRDTAHKYRVLRHNDNSLSVSRVATFPTYDTPFDSERADAIAAAEAGAIWWLSSTVEVRGAFRVMLVGPGRPGCVRTLGVGLCRTHQSMHVPSVEGYIPQRYDDSIVAVTCKEHEIHELVGSHSTIEDKLWCYYCSTCASIADKPTCAVCGAVREPHSTFMGGHMPLTPTVASAIEMSGHIFSSDPSLPYVRGMAEWAHNYLLQNTDRSNQPRRCIKLC